MKLWNELLEYIKAYPNGTDKKQKTLEQQFRPKVWVAKTGRKVYRMDDLPMLELTETELDEILSIVWDIKPEPRHFVYNELYFKTGGPLRIHTSSSSKYDYYYLYVNNRYIVPMFIRTVDISERQFCLHPPRTVLGAGTNAMIQINDDLRKSGMIGNKSTLTTELVPKKYRKLKHVLKMCVPNQIGWYDVNEAGTKLDNCFKADVSSAFPFQLTKAIPTLKDAMYLQDKYLAPDEEYPFVFTYKLGQTFGRVEILNELDTDIDIKNKYMRQVSNQLAHSETRLAYLKGVYEDTAINLNPLIGGSIANEFICIRCKKADITLAQVMNLHYNLKLNATDKLLKDYEKMVMNALIGFMQRNGNGTLPFISAVVIARQNHRMLEICAELERNGNIPVYIATDSIIWEFANDTVATKDKYLGSFTMEYEDCQAYIIQVGAYQIKKDNKTTTWCSYLPNGDSKQQIEFGKLPKPKNKQFNI